MRRSAGRLQAPLVDELMTELGFKSGESPNNLLHRLSQSIADDREKTAGNKSQARVASTGKKSLSARADKDGHEEA